jgi:hypothetical protein
MHSGGKSRCRFKSLRANSRAARAGNFPRGAGNFAVAPQNGVNSCEARDLECGRNPRYVAQPREVAPRLDDGSLRNWLRCRGTFDSQPRGDAVTDETERRDNSARADPAAFAVALGQTGTLDPRAAAFLEKQSRLADEQIALTRLQAEELRREESLRHRALHMHHASDAIKLAFEIVMAVIVFAVAVGIGAAIWSASRADGLVIDAFQVPQSMAAQGLSGQVVASKLLDRLAAMQNAARSSRVASSFAHDWTNDIKVEIPETGISLGEAMRYLRNALGHETHLSGEVYATANGIALTLRLNDEPGQTFEGKPDALNALAQKAAEAVFREAQPYRYSVYLAGQHRFPESAEVQQTLTRTGPKSERAWGYNGLALRAELEGRFAESEAYAQRALLENPLLPNAMSVYANDETRQGHDEDALAATRRTMDSYRGAGARELDPATIEPSLLYFALKAAEYVGDYGLALRNRNALVPVPGLVNAAGNTAGGAVDAALSHDPALARSQLAELTPADLAFNIESSTVAGAADYARGLAAAEEDWRMASSYFARGEDEAQHVAQASNEAFNGKYLLAVLDGPWLAYSDAKLGRQAKADAILATLAPDCYLCNRMRGRIAATRKNWNGAAWWFGKAAAQAPSIPFAFADWGAMLMEMGDFDGAVEKFKTANAKGPHFADPLEMWGEALMRENRSDLALAKFADANKDAPNWGRLHLKWGEALLWSGNGPDAKKQFALAARLDLSATDRAALAEMSAMGNKH